MANMSYCRHENTLNDLRDVWEQWDEDLSESSSYELRARRQLIKLVQEMADNIDIEYELEQIEAALKQGE